MKADQPEDKKFDETLLSSDGEQIGLQGIPDTGEDPLNKIGSVLGGKYKIRGHVKGGGFAEVYQGFNINLPDQRVIIKFLRDQTLGDRFEKEAQLLCRLDHPNICRVIDYLPAEYALIVPFIDGKDCERIIRSTGPLRRDVFLKVAVTITEALAFAHARKIAHRDIKPGNILIDRHGIPYLIDFGIAKEISIDSTATRTGYVALTPQFAAPERQSGMSGYNPFLSDIYEIGVTLFVLATGELPYHNAAYPSLRDWDRTFQRPLAPALLRVLQKAAHPTPTERVQTADELAAMLRQIETVDAQPQRPTKAKWIAAAAVALAIIGVGLWQFWPSSGQDSSQHPAAEGEAEPGVNPTSPSGSTALPQEKSADQPAQGAVTPPIVPIDTPTTATTVSSARAKARFEVIPRDGSVCFMDGAPRELDTDAEISEGTHRLRIVNPRYPILERSVRVGSRDTALVYDLEQEFAGRDTVDMRIALNPPSSDYDLEISLNGSARTCTSFPVRDMKRLAGRWALSARLVAHDAVMPGPISVDSIVTFPYGGGPHILVRGSRGDIDFGAPAWAGKHVVPLLINWSVAPKK